MAGVKVFGKYNFCGSAWVVRACNWCVIIFALFGFFAAALCSPMSVVRAIEVVGYEY